MNLSPDDLQKLWIGIIGGLIGGSLTLVGILIRWAVDAGLERRRRGAQYRLTRHENLLTLSAMFVEIRSLVWDIRYIVWNVKRSVEAQDKPAFVEKKAVFDQKVNEAIIVAEKFGRISGKSGLKQRFLSTYVASNLSDFVEYYLDMDQNYWHWLSPSGHMTALLEDIRSLAEYELEQYTRGTKVGKEKGTFPELPYLTRLERHVASGLVDVKELDFHHYEEREDHIRWEEEEEAARRAEIEAKRKAKAEPTEGSPDPAPPSAQ